MMKIGLRVLLFPCLLAFILGLPIAASAASPVKVRFGHLAPPFLGQSKGVDAFAAYVKEKTNGRIDIVTFPMGQLGGERSMAEQVQSGTLRMASISTAMLQNFVPQAAVLDMPFIFPDRRSAYATMDDPEVQKKVFSYFPQKGFIAIGWTENEFRDFANSKRPVRKPADMKGLQVSVMNAPVYLDTFTQLGATPVSIPFPEIYNALQTGVVDAQEDPILTSVLMRFTDVTKNVTITNHSLNAGIIIVSPDYWETLSPEEQQIFREAAKVAIDTNRKVNAELHNKLPSGIGIAEYCRKNSVEVIDLTPGERKEFQKAVVPVWNKYRKKIGNDIFDFLLTKIKEHQP